MGAPAGVLRGGSWNNESTNVRAANRNRNNPDNRNDNNGFRCARPLSNGLAAARMLPAGLLSELPAGGVCAESERRTSPSGQAR